MHSSIGMTYGSASGQTEREREQRFLSYSILLGDRERREGGRAYQLCYALPAGRGIKILLIHPRLLTHVSAQLRLRLSAEANSETKHLIINIIIP